MINPADIERLDAVSLRQIERIIERHDRIKRLLAKHNFDAVNVLCEENLFDADDFTDETAELVNAIREQSIRE